MRKYTASCIGLMLILLLSCGGVEPDKQKVGRATANKLEAQTKLNTEMKRMVLATSRLATSLKDLNPTQKASVAALIMISSDLAVVRAGGIQVEGDILGRFRNSLNAFCPELGNQRVIVERGGPCSSQSMAYAEAMAKCEDDGKAESECYDAMDAMSGMISCTMKELETTYTGIADILGNSGSPDPLPLPVESPDSVDRMWEATR